MESQQRGDRIAEFQVLGATTVIFLSFIVLASILRQRTGKTFQKLLLAGAALLLSAAVASNVTLSTLLQTQSADLIILSKKIQATFDILFALVIGAFLVVTSTPRINSLRDFRQHMVKEFPNSYVVYSFVMALGLFSVLSVRPEVAFPPQGGFSILFPLWFLVMTTVTMSTIMVYIPYKLLGYLHVVQPPRSVARDTTFILLGLEGFTVTEFFTEVAYPTLFPSLAFDVRIVGFLVEVLLIALVAFAVRERRFLQELLAPVPEAHLDTAPSFRLEGGYTYLIQEAEPAHALEIFTDMVTHGVRGLCITRQQPERVAEAYGLEKTPVLWLSRAVAHANCVRPTPAENVAMAIDHFLEISPGSVVVLDGVEYLMAHNDFPSVLTLLHDLNERVSITDSILLLPVDPGAFDDREFALLRRDLRRLPEGVRPGPPVAEVAPPASGR